METVREISAVCFDVVSFITVVLFTFKPCSYNVHFPVACVDVVLLVLSNQNYIMYLEFQGSTTVKKAYHHTFLSETSVQFMCPHSVPLRAI